MATQSSTAGIETIGLSRSYARVPAVRDLSLRVERGTIYGFVGPNGAGKTTTLRMLLGLVRPTAGSIAILGRERAWGERLDRRVGAMLERPVLYPQLSARENLSALAMLRGVDQASAIPDESLRAVGLDPGDQRPAGRLSAGTRQRVAIAQALLGRPAVLVLDEPTDGLDPGGIVELRHILEGAAADGCAVLMSSHLISEVERVCTRVGLLVQGRLVAELGQEEVRRGIRGTRLAFSDATEAARARRILEDAGIRTVGQDAYSLTVGHIGHRAADARGCLVAADIWPVTEAPATVPLEDLFLSFTTAVAGWQ